MRTVVTFGTFDMFHMGHLRLLERAKALGDRLVVGVSSDSLNFSKKARFPVICYSERAAIVAALKFVDEVFVEESLERKVEYLKAHGANVLVMGDDWRGKFDFVRGIGVEPVYLERTKDISTTEIIQKLSNSSNIGEFEEFFHKLIQKKDVLQDYYRFAEIFTKILGDHGIEYFAHSGTMLGCVRHGGFIPWDDDMDIMVEDKYEEKLLSLAPVFAEYGILLHDGGDESNKRARNEGGWHQYFIKNPALPTSLRRYYPIDIFIGAREPDDNTIHYKNPSFRRWFPKRFVRASDIYPLTEYKFGPIKLLGMRDYSDYFARSGFNLEVAVIERIHSASEATLAEIKRFNELGVLPTRVPQYLHFREEVDLPEAPLSNFLLPKAPAV